MPQIFSGILEAYAASQRPFENMPILTFFGYVPTCLGLVIIRFDEEVYHNNYFY